MASMTNMKVEYSDKVNIDRRLTEEVKELARKMGAELVGVGNVERWKNAPLMLSPQGLLPTARTVIVCGVSFLDASMELTENEISQHWYNPYDKCEELTGMNDRLDSIAFNLAKFLESKGYRSLPTPITGLWRIRPYDSIDHPFAPALANRYAAVAAGLGEIGWNGLFLSPEYGPRQRLVPVVTEAPLDPTPMYNGPPLCDKCMICVKKCPLDCFRKEVKKINRLEISGRVFEFPDINKWRCYLDYYNIFGHFLPEHITEEIAVGIAHSERRPRKPLMDSGACLCSCVPPDLRYRDKEYFNAWRRKRQVKEVDGQEVTEKVKSMILESGIDYLGIVTEEEFIKKGIDLKEYLPDAASALVMGIRYANDFMDIASWQRLQKTLFDVSHYLQGLGYSTLPVPRIPADTIARSFNFEEKDTHFIHLITAFDLKPSKISPSPGKKKKKKLSSRDVKLFALDSGADLVGITSVERLEKIYPRVRSLYSEDKIIKIKGERTGGPTQVLKDVSIEDIKIKGPKDHLDSGRSVIVLGLHYPAAVIERAAKPPAENFVSYTRFANKIAFNELNSLAFGMVRFLNREGYDAVPVLDSFGTALVNRSDRGFAVTVNGSRFDPAAAGLGEIGWCGEVMTPEYGLTQRFVSIITDAALDPDPVYEGPPLCKKCFRCVDACPVNAISRKEKSTFEIEDKIFEFGKLDRLRCDWAKWGALVGEEGPKYLGITKNIMPPEEITAEAVHNALRQFSPVELSWAATYDKCLSVCANYDGMRGDERSHRS
jgi:epoxyqueuosine reductase QueG